MDRGRGPTGPTGPTRPTGPVGLSPAERAVTEAFATGVCVDVGGAPVRATVIASLLLGQAEPSAGAVPGVQVQRAKITGRLDVAFAEIGCPVRFDGCVFEQVPRLTGASTRTLELTGCTLPGFEGRLLSVRGDLRLNRSQVTGQISLENADVTGTLQLTGLRVTCPGGRAISAGGVVVRGGLVGRGRLGVQGEARFIGARVDGGVLLEGARFSHPGGTALCLDDLVTNRVMLSDGFTAEGELRIRNAQVSGELSLRGARLLAAQRALRARGMTAGELVMLPAEVTGLVDLSRVQVGALRDSVETWPEHLRLDGLGYDHLLPVGPPIDVRGRCRWLRRDPQEYRPHPYEQLAAYYRRLGHDDDARRVLLAKERRRRDTLPPVARISGYLLDGLVGYGYRSWLAGVWLAVLVLLGTAVFSSARPEAIDPTHRPHFTALVYTVDLLIPIGAFGLRTAYDPLGWTRWVADALIAAGWILATALVAGVSRRIGRD